MKLIHSYTILGRPVSVNHAYISAVRGKRVIRFPSKEFKAVKEFVKKFCVKDLAEPTDKDLFVIIDLYYPDKRRRDLDNPLKVIFDSGNKVIWNDDSQIKNLYVESHLDREIPRTEVYVYEKPWKNLHLGRTIKRISI